MIENQYILEPAGLLDAVSAGRIAQELRSLLRAGRHHVRIAAAELSPVLPEGIAALEQECVQIAAEFAPPESRDGSGPAPDGVRIEIFELTEQGSTQFLLRGRPVSGHSLVLVDTHQLPEDVPEVEARTAETTREDATPEGVPPADAAPKHGDVSDASDTSRRDAGDGARIIRCESCDHSIRVPGPGDYGCPNCSATFHMGSGGQVAFFEMAFPEEGDDPA